MHPRTRAFLEEAILTTAEVAKLTGLTEVAIKKRVARGKIECVKKGGIYLFDARDFRKK